MNYHRMSTEHLRQQFKWMTYGKYGTATPKKVKLCEMSEKHIRNCLKNERLSKSTKTIFGRELSYRKRHGITDQIIFKSHRNRSRRRFGTPRPTEWT